MPQLHEISEIQRYSKFPSKWPALRFLCVVACDRNDEWGANAILERRLTAPMRVWENVRCENGNMSWGEPVDVHGRCLAEDFRGMTQMARNDWDEWLVSSGCLGVGFLLGPDDSCRGGRVRESVDIIGEYQNAGVSGVLFL